MGRTPIYDGICASCGTLLYGSLNDTGMGNKRSGVPVTKDGGRQSLNGRLVTNDSQPPFLLRWMPAFFANHVPDVFQWNAETKKLRLKDAHRERPPWCRPPHHRATDMEESWLYCVPCHGDLFGGTEDEGPTVAFHDSKSVDTLDKAPPNVASSMLLKRKNANGHLHWMR